MKNEWEHKWKHKIYMIFLRVYKLKLLKSDYNMLSSLIACMQVLDITDACTVETVSRWHTRYTVETVSRWNTRYTEETVSNWNTRYTE